MYAATVHVYTTTRLVVWNTHANSSTWVAPLQGQPCPQEEQPSPQVTWFDSRHLVLKLYRKPKKFLPTAIISLEAHCSFDLLPKCASVNDLSLRTPRQKNQRAHKGLSCAAKPQNSRPPSATSFSHVQDGRRSTYDASWQRNGVAYFDHDRLIYCSTFKARPGQLCTN